MIFAAVPSFRSTSIRLQNRFGLLTNPNRRTGVRKNVHGKRQPESLVCQNPKTFLQTGRYASKTIRMQKESLRETNFEATVARFEFPRRKVLDPGGALGRFASPAAGHPEKSSDFENGPLLVVPCLFGKTGSRNLFFFRLGGVRAQLPKDFPLPRPAHFIAGPSLPNGDRWPKNVLGRRQKLRFGRHLS